MPARNSNSRFALIGAFLLIVLAVGAFAGWAHEGSIWLPLILTACLWSASMFLAWFVLRRRRRNR